MRDRIANALQAVGALSVSAAAFAVSTPLGLFTAGCLMIVAGFVVGVADRTR